MVHLFYFYYNVVLPRTQHTFAEERVLVDFQRPSGTGTGEKKETRHLYVFTPMGQSRNATWSVFTFSRAVNFGICFFSSQWPELLFSTNVHTWYSGGMKGWAAGPVVLGSLMALEPLYPWSCRLASCKSFLFQFCTYKMHDSPLRCQGTQRLCVPVIKG